MTATEVVKAFVHLERRLRLRSPATPAEKAAWSKLREAARKLYTQDQQEETK